MTLNYLKERRELVSVFLLIVSAVSAVLIVVKLNSYFANTAKAETLISRAVAQNDMDAEGMGRYFTSFKALADELKKNNLFAPAPPKQNPVRAIAGILGSEVLINNKWYKVGDKVADAKIVAIEPTKVTIEWDGKNKDFSPIDAFDSGGSPGPSRSRPTETSVSADMVVIGAAPTGGPSGRASGGRDTGGGRGGMRGRFGNMSDEERERFMTAMRERRAQFENMSPAERERFREEMRQRFGGGMPGGGRRGGR